MTISSLPLALNDNSLISVLISVKKNKTKVSIKHIQNFLPQQVWDNCGDLQDSCADMALGMDVARVVDVYLALRIFIGVERNLFGSFTLKLGAMGNPLGNIEPYMNEGDFPLSI